MKPFRIALVMFALFMSATVVVADWAEVFHPLTASVLRLESMSDDGSLGICSSVVLNKAKGYVLTAAHCVPSGSDVSLAVDGRDAILLKKNAIIDLAVLRSHLTDVANIEMAPASPLPGASVAVVGYAFGSRSLTIQAGIVSNPFDVDTQRLWMNVDTIPGDSGGVVVDAEGRLVGITSAVMSHGAASHIGLAIPYERVHDFIEEYLPPAPTVSRRR